MYIYKIYIYIYTHMLLKSVESMKRPLTRATETHRDRNAERLLPLGSRKDYFHPAEVGVGQPRWPNMDWNQKKHTETYSKHLKTILWMAAKSCTTKRMVESPWIMGWSSYQLLIRISKPSTVCWRNMQNTSIIYISWWEPSLRHRHLWIHWSRSEHSTQEVSNNQMTLASGRLT